MHTKLKIAMHQKTNIQMDTMRQNNNHKWTIKRRDRMGAAAALICLFER